MSKPTKELEKNSYHYTNEEEVPEVLKKYWYQRYSIFSKYDAGIQLNDKAWFSVTPEPIAKKISNHIAENVSNKKSIIIDAFAGAGGNVITFALSGRWEQIFAIENDTEILNCAKENARIYGVAKKIWWIQGDCFDIIKSRFKSMSDKVVIFASPPWGGPTYTDLEIFDLSVMQPYNLDYIYQQFSKITKEIVVYLPRNSNLNQIASYGPLETSLPVIHYCMRGSSKALVAYYGEFSDPAQS